MVDPASIGIILAALAIVAAGFYFLKKRREQNKWGMDPRLRPLAEWAYACMLDVTGLAEGNDLPVPNVRGVDAPWGDRVFGEFFWPSRNIKVQITKDYNWLVNIMLHEMGHDGDRRVNGKHTGEEFANWVNKQCKESVRPDFYPAPKLLLKEL